MTGRPGGRRRGRHSTCAAGAIIVLGAIPVLLPGVAFVAGRAAAAEPAPAVSSAHEGLPSPTEPPSRGEPPLQAEPNSQPVPPARKTSRHPGAAPDAQPAGTLPAVGEAAPPFSLPGRDGGSVTLEARRGKFVYLAFWASWCPSCQQAFPWMNALQKQYGPRGLEVVAIGVDTRPADAEAFLAEHPADFTVAYDISNRVVRHYSIRTMPSSLLIAPDGTVRLLHEGYAPADQHALEQSIRRALALP